MAQATSNPEMIKRTRALAAFSSAKEYASIQRAIIAAALPGGDDAGAAGLSENDRLYGQAARDNGETELTAFKSIYESTGGNADELTGAAGQRQPDDHGGRRCTPSACWTTRTGWPSRQQALVPGLVRRRHDPRSTR